MEERKSKRGREKLDKKKEPEEMEDNETFRIRRAQKEGKQEDVENEPKKTNTVQQNYLYFPLLH